MKVIRINTINVDCGKMHSSPTHHIINESPNIYIPKQTIDAIHIRNAVNSQNTDLICSLLPSATKLTYPCINAVQ